MARKPCVVCGTAQAVRPGGKCNRCHAAAGGVPENPNVQKIEMRNVADLRPHPKNAEIYGDEPDADFVESVKSHGVLVPLIVASGSLVISGHRRLAAAAAAGLAEVPIIPCPVADELDLLETLVLCNRQRTKTNEQVGREYEALRWVYGQRNKGQQREESVQRCTDSSQNGSKIHPKAAAASALGVSVHTATDAAKTVQVIDELRGEGKAEEAEAIRETLNRRGAAPARKQAAAAKRGDFAFMSSAAPEAESAAESPAPAPAAVDQLGNPVTGPAAESFAVVARFKQLEKLLREAAALVNEIADLPGAEVYRTRLGLEERAGKRHFRCADVRNAQLKVRDCQPHAAHCPACNGDGRGENRRACGWCKGKPYLDKPLYERIAEFVKLGGRIKTRAA